MNNFDKALLHTAQSQASGQDTAPQVPMIQEPAVNTMLLQELSEAKSRMDSLESLNASYQQRVVLLEQQVAALQREKEHHHHEMKSLRLELRIAQLETEHAARSLEDKTASLKEMQLEIDLVTKASVNATVHASQGGEMANSFQSDKQQLQDLQNHVQALQEWAMASTEAKSLAMERVRLLECQLKQQRERNNISEGGHVRVLWKKTSSLVIGAGDIRYEVLELGEETSTLMSCERAVLRWEIDSTPSELPVLFSLLKGVCDSTEKQSRANRLIKEKYVLHDRTV